MRRPLTLLLFTVLLSTAVAQDFPVTVRLDQFAAGDGPSHVGEGHYRLLDASHTPGQSNALAVDVAQEGAFEQVSLRCKLRVLPGGDGGAFVFLNTAEYGKRGPAPFVKSWVEPNLARTFAVGIDVHDPKNEEMFGEWGNYQGLPEREVSLHWDGREIVKRVAPAEFRGDVTECEITVQHVIGGADVTVRLAGEAVYDAYFVPGLLPYESRLAIGAGTRADAWTEFDVEGIEWKVTEPAHPRRAPKHFEVFNHVLTDGAKQAFEKEITLPPLGWAFGRVILTLDIHDAGPDWDEWDRNGEISIFDAEGVKRGIVPFITSYRTPCHWEVDVTHFRPWLAGNVRFEVAAGTNFYKNRGFMMSVSLDFHHGTADLAPFRVVPLWVGTARYKSAENHFSDFFTSQTVAIDESTQAARIFTTTTGHSQVGEFTPSERTILFRPDTSAERSIETQFDDVLWKTDCYLNPNRPQFGTWKFSRAGWAPGDVVRPWWIDLTPYVAAGKTAEIRYEPKPYDFAGAPSEETPDEKQINEASHVVRSYLILYRRPDGLMAAPALQVTNVAGDSNASRAGVQEGDYLASYDGVVLGTVDDLRNAIGGAVAAGKERIPVVVYRGAERMEMEVGPGKMGVGLAER